MTLGQLFSPCVFGHASDPVFVVQDHVMRYACRRCLADLGEVLPNQVYRARKVPKVKKAKKLAQVKAFPRKAAG
jgi:hypothetical protein